MKRMSGDWVTVVHGGASGADSMAGKIARECFYKEEVHPADWATHGRKAGLLRNAAMVEAGADLCIAGWDGRSTGTLDTIRRCVQAGIPVRIVPQAQQV